MISTYCIDFRASNIMYCIPGPSIYETFPPFGRFLRGEKAHILHLEGPGINVFVEIDGFFYSTILH